MDYLAVLTVADLAVESGASRFVLVSSVGADMSSTNFYLRVKGEAEAAVTKRAFSAVHVLRPGLLIGARTESRPAEALAQAIAPFLNPLLMGPLRKYSAVGADDVGAAMVAAALGGAPGRHVLHYDEITRLARYLHNESAR